MIYAGFFSCNVGDRVICIYCNIICQQWTSDSADPSEIHKKISPKCPYVIAMLECSKNISNFIINEQSLTSQSSGSTRTDDLLRCHGIVYAKPLHTAYMELPKRHESFTTWPTKDVPSVDDLVKAGFFYSGTGNVVTCFYCSGSLQNWGPNDNPIIEHARWFPYCEYAKQLCGDDMHRKIQESKRIHREIAQVNDTNSRFNERALVRNKSDLSRLVAARLDLPASQRLLNQNFKLSIIKRCWEDQLRIKHNDFASDIDLFVACIILQKQVAHINGKTENIIIPSIAMMKIHEREEAENNSPIEPPSTNPPVKNHIENTSLLSITTTVNSKTSRSSDNKENSSSPIRPCILCLEAEKCIACIPCGHLSTCVPCGYSLRSCPICRRTIEGFMRINM